MCENGKCKLYNFCLLEDSSRIVRIKKSMVSTYFAIPFNVEHEFARMGFLDFRVCTEKMSKNYLKVSDRFLCRFV